MKNSNLFKKFAAIVVSAMMVLSTLAVPTFAADGDMTINGVEDNATVKGYKVVFQDTDTQWKMTDTFGEEHNGVWYVKGTYDEDSDPKGVVYPMDGTAPSAAVLAELAKLATGNGDITFVGDEANGYVNSGTEKGSWLVLVTPGAAGTIYNPMVVSRDYTAGGAVSATEANAKKSNIPFEKVVERTNPTGTNVPNDSVTGDGLSNDDDASATDGNFDGTADGNKGDTAGSTGGSVTLDADGNATFSAKGATFDDVAFRINTKIPAYAENYFKADENGDYPAKVGDFYNPTFKIDDELSKGLTLNQDSIVVKVNGTEVKAGDDTFSVKLDDTTKDFIITFAPALIKANGGKSVEVCYSAKLNKDHGVNFDQETNTAKLYYSNKPGDNTTVDEEKETYHYTFTINGNLEGETSDENREVIKVGIDENGDRVMEETSTITKTGWKPLQGVEFKLYKANAAGDAPDKSSVVKEVITDKDGILRGMDQIDAGVYYLVETSVGPNTQYAKDETPIKIEITPTLDSKGRMTAYTVKVNNIVVGNYEKDWSAASPAATTVTNARKVQLEKDDTTNTYKYDYDDNDAQAADIVNTKVGTLPSTGGMGTVIFTVGGIAIMALAIFLLFGGKKRKEQE